MPQSKFLLRCCQSRYPDINLPDGVEVIVGRNAQTKLKDFRLSRKHASLVANEKEEKIVVNQIGANSSFFSKKNSSEEKKSIPKGQPVLLRPGDLIELLDSQYKYRIIARNISRPLATMSQNFGGSPHPNHWSQALYTTMKDPSMVEFEDDVICIIKDRYPKARHHYLVLPKEKFTDLSNLNGDHVDLIKQMVKQAKALAERKKMGTYKMGFHCVPSMAQVHMHLISEDFDSPCLKNKKHWNSFNTKYFIDPEEVLKYLAEEGQVPFETWKSEAKDLLSTDLKCHKCDYKPKHLPDLKKHILKHFE